MASDGIIKAGWRTRICLLLRHSTTFYIQVTRFTQAQTSFTGNIHKLAFQNAICVLQHSISLVYF